MFLVFHHLQKDKQCKLRHSLCEARWEKTRVFQTQLSSTVTILTDEDCFYYCSDRNNVVVLFGTLKVQFFMLTEVKDCDLLMVFTSSTFLKRKDMLKEKSSESKISSRLSGCIYTCVLCTHIRIYVCRDLVHLDSSGPPSVSSWLLGKKCTHLDVSLTPSKLSWKNSIF